MCCPVLFPQDRGLERPHISGCCQAGVRGRDSKGQLFSTRYPGSLTHGLWSSLASLTSHAPPNPPPLMYECVSGYVYVRGRTHESRAVIGVVRGTSGGKPWNRRWNLSGKIKWEATLNQGFCSLPLSSFSNKANNFSGMQQGQLDVYSAEILEYGGDKWIVKHACAHAHVEQHYILLHMQFSCVIKEVMLQFICDGHGIKAKLDQIICRGRKLYKAYK